MEEKKSTIQISSAHDNYDEDIEESANFDLISDDHSHGLARFDHATKNNLRMVDNNNRLTDRRLSQLQMYEKSSQQHNQSLASTEFNNKLEEQQSQSRNNALSI